MSIALRGMPGSVVAPVCASTINRVLSGFITSFSQCIALYVNNIATYENYCASICLKLRLNCASGGFREQLLKERNQ
jgi:hypothetical protein